MKSNFPAPRLGTAWLAVLFAAFLAALFTTLPAQAAPPVDYGGHYELLTTGKNPGRQFSLEVLQTGSRADVAFSAAMADGNGAATEGKGRGHVSNSVLSFKFKDNFSNEGTCTLQRNLKGDYVLTMTVTKVVETTPLHFYGDVMLQKTAPRPATP